MSGVAAYLAQEYVAAESLDLAVREYGPAPVADALRVAAQLAGALDFASIVNVHHGALHPRDVLLSSDETRLTGIGVAQALQRIGVAIPVRRPYTAPERLNDKPIDARTDVFGLAAVVYELLSGKRIAGAGAHAVDALADVAGGDPAAVRAVFARTLAEKPADRFATALEFVDALKQAIPQSAVGSPQSAVDSRRSSPASLPFDVPEASDRADIEITPPDLPLAAPAPEPDLAIFAAEEQRSEQVEVAPAVAAFATAEDAEDAEDQKYNVVTSASPAPSAVAPQVYTAALDRTRSAVWPLLLAVIVGLAVGFALGYGAGGRDRSAPPAQADDATPSPAATSGKEFTETAVPPPAAADKPADAQPPAISRLPSAISPEPPAAEAAGRLLIRSTPAGARVTVDGHDEGVTPAVVRNLPAGPHNVRVSRDGYVTGERRIVLTDERPAQSMVFPLAREAASAPAASAAATAGRFIGELMVDSRPSGAKVFLDGRLVGTTPFTVGSLRAGEHAVRLERDGYRRWSSSVRVVAGERNRVTASLER